VLDDLTFPTPFALARCLAVEGSRFFDEDETPPPFLLLLFRIFELDDADADFAAL